MRKCTFSELCEKEVINCVDCTKLGSVFDCVIDLDCGTIISVIVEPEGKLFCFGKQENCISIPWECIKKIGDDIILVDFAGIPLPQTDCRNNKQKFFKNN